MVRIRRSESVSVKRHEFLTLALAVINFDVNKMGTGKYVINIYCIFNVYHKKDEGDYYSVVR
jgi:hypothetical protein